MPADRSRPNGDGPSQSRSQWTSISADDSIESQTPFLRQVFPPPRPAIVGPELAGQNPSWHPTRERGAFATIFVGPTEMGKRIQVLNAAVPQALEARPAVL